MNLINRLTAAVGFLCSASLFAADGKWVKTEEFTYGGSNPEAVRAALVNGVQNELLASLHREATAALLTAGSINLIKELHVTISTYRWDGPSSCPAGDARLTVRIGSYTLTRETGASSGLSESFPSNGDPCH